MTTEATKLAAQALIQSRLDYCNSVLVNLATSQTERLQRIQNKAARMISRTPLQQHITPVMKQLHWLPVERRVVFKTLVLVYKCIHGRAPSYIQNLLQVRGTQRTLRQSNAVQLHQPINKRRVGSQAFGIAAPRLWNALPTDIKQARTIITYKKLLKTHLFRQSYD